MALDSTNLRMPNGKALLAAFGTLSNGKGSQVPQARRVLLQFPLVRLPYRYEWVPVREGEKVIAERLLQGLHPQDLVLYDRGFWSYRLVWTVQRQGAFFVIRRSNQGKLKNLRRLGDRDWLVRWTPRDKKWIRLGFPAAAAHDQLPLRLSFTHAVRELEDFRLPLMLASFHRACHVLLPRLWARIAAHGVPERPGRHYHRPHDTDIKKATRGRIRLPSKLPPSPPKCKGRNEKPKERRKHAA